MVQEHKCNSCFYMESPKEAWPCNACEGYNRYVNRNIYINQPDTVVMRKWDAEDAFTEQKAWKVSATEDVVNSPKHYTSGKFEVIDVIEDWQLNFRLANAVKYIARHKHKGKPVEDLKKALWYLQREIDKHGEPDA